MHKFSLSLVLVSICALVNAADPKVVDYNYWIHKSCDPYPRLRDAIAEAQEGMKRMLDRMNAHDQKEDTYMSFLRDTILKGRKDDNNSGIWLRYKRESSKTIRH